MLNSTSESSSWPGQGSRWRGWYIDAEDKERRKNCPRKPAAQKWSIDQGNAILKGTWIAPERGKETLEVVANKWLATKAHRTPPTLAEYESVLKHYILRAEVDMQREDQLDNLREVAVAKVAAVHACSNWLVIGLLVVWLALGNRL